LTIHKPGIYFNMSEEEYHSDESISKSGLTKLLDSPEDFWYYSHMNPEAPERESKDCLDKGTLWHTRILQPEIFDDKYISCFAPKDITSLKTVKDMQEFLSVAGIDYKKSSSKEELANIVINSGLNSYLVDYEFEKMQSANLDKTVIFSEKVWNDMLYAEGIIKSNPEFSKAFEGGYSEVSLFWIDMESGLPMKARLDKLKPDTIYDYKTMSVRRGKTMDKQCLDAIKYEKYDLQVAQYVLGTYHIVEGIKSGNMAIEGNPDGAFMDQFLKNPLKPFKFIFQQSEKPCAVRGKTVEKNNNDRFNAFGAGIHYIETGIQIYQDYMSRYGTKQWIDPRGFEPVGETDIFYY
jgi:hypothetical protein